MNCSLGWCSLPSCLANVTDKWPKGLSNQSKCSKVNYSHRFSLEKSSFDLNHMLTLDGLSIFFGPWMQHLGKKPLYIVSPVCWLRLPWHVASELDSVPVAHRIERLFDLLIAHCLPSVRLPISLLSSSVQVMACHREIIGCHTAVITCRNCLQALDWWQ